MKYVYKTVCPLPAEFRQLLPGDLTLYDLNFLFAESITPELSTGFFGAYRHFVELGSLEKIVREKEGDANLVIYRYFTDNQSAHDFQTMYAVPDTAYKTLYPGVVSGSSESFEQIGDDEYALITGNVSLVDFILTE